MALNIVMGLGTDYSKTFTNPGCTARMTFGNVVLSAQINTVNGKDYVIAAHLDMYINFGADGGCSGLSPATYEFTGCLFVRGQIDNGMCNLFFDSPRLPANRPDRAPSFRGTINNDRLNGTLSIELYEPGTTIAFTVNIPIA